MKKIFILLLLVLMTENAFGETHFSIEKDTLLSPQSAQWANIEFYFNSSFAADKTRLTPASAAFRLEDARIYMYGNYNKDLSCSFSPKSSLYTLLTRQCFGCLGHGFSYLSLW